MISLNIIHYVQFRKRVEFKRCISLPKKAFDEVDWTSNFVQILVVLLLTDFYASILLPFHWSNHLNRVDSSFTLNERHISIYTSCQKWRLKNSILSIIHWYHDVKWILFNPSRMKNHPIKTFISGILDCQQSEIGTSKWLYLFWVFFMYNFFQNFLIYRNYKNDMFLRVFQSMRWMKSYFYDA